MKISLLEERENAQRNNREIEDEKEQENNQAELKKAQDEESRILAEKNRVKKALQFSSQSHSICIFLYYLDNNTETSLRSNSYNQNGRYIPVFYF